jgi:uncharacterized protein YciI
MVPRPYNEGLTVYKLEDTAIMWYVVNGIDAAESLSKRQASRPAHVARIQMLADEGRLLTAGPLPAIDAVDPGPAGFTGSLIIAEFDSLEAAKAWADQDPYLQSGAWTAVTVSPYVQVKP